MATAVDSHGIPEISRTYIIHIHLECCWYFWYFSSVSFNQNTCTTDFVEIALGITDEKASAGVPRITGDRDTFIITDEGRGVVRVINVRPAANWITYIYRVR